MEAIKYLTIMTSNLAKSSQQTYNSVVTEYIKYLKGYDYKKITQEHIWDYIYFLKQKIGIKDRYSNDVEFSSVTINKNLAILRRFYAFLLSIKKIKVNEFENLQFKVSVSKSRQKRATEAFSFCDVARMLDLPNLGTKQGVRDSAMLSILFSTSMRVSELIALSICDFKTSTKGTRFIRIRKAKGGKLRDTAIPEWAVRPILRLIEQRQKETSNVNDPLIVSYDLKGYWQNKEVNRKTIYKIFVKYAKRLGLKNLSPHSARASVVTKLLADGKSHNEVKEVSGHASIQMVELYNKRMFAVDDQVSKNICWN